MQSYLLTDLLPAAGDSTSGMLPPVAVPPQLSDAERFRFAFENAAVGIFQTTPEGRFLRVNQALAKLLGYESPQSLAGAVGDVGHEVYVDPSRRAEFKRLIHANGAIMNFDTEVRCRNGQTTWISVNAWAVRDGVGQILYYEGFIEDLGQRIGDTVATKYPQAIAHKQPANPVQLRSTVNELIRLLGLLGGTPLSPQQHRHLREAQVAAESVARLID